MFVLVLRWQPGSKHGKYFPTMLTGPDSVCLGVDLCYLYPFVDFYRTNTERGGKEADGKVFRQKFNLFLLFQVHDWGIRLLSN